MINNPNFRKGVDFKKGTKLELEFGAYSDLCIVGFFRVLRDIDSERVKQIYLVNRELAGEEDRKGDMYTFAHFLVEEGYVKEIEYNTWFLGGYKLFDTDEGR